MKIERLLRGLSHGEAAEHAATLEKATKVAAGISVAAAWAAAPTGLTALGVSVGLISAPLVVGLAPMLIAVAGVSATVSAGASLYSKYRNRGESGTAAVPPGASQ